MLQLLPHTLFHYFTFEENDRVSDALSFGTLDGRVDIVRDPREHLRDGLGPALFQGLLMVVEHLVLLQQPDTPNTRHT